MNNLSKFMLGAMAFGLWSCSSDEPLVNSGVDETAGDFYATLTLELPSTRSMTTDDRDSETATSDAGVEYGSLSENNVDDVLIVLASASDENVTENTTFSYITYGYSRSSLLDASSYDPDFTTPTYALQFDSSVIANYLGDKVYVFAYCNPSDALVGEFQNGNIKLNDTDWVNKTLSIADSSATPMGPIEICKENSFVMTNATLTSQVIGNGENTKEEFMANHNSPGKAFDLGTVKVERLAARFDFDAYNVNFTVKDNLSDEEVADVTFVSLALFNEAKEMYYLPRVNSTGFGAGVLCGRETSSNWMVGPYADQFPKSAENLDLSVFGKNGALQNNYLFAIGSPEMESYEKGLVWTDINDLHIHDNDNSWTLNGMWGNYKVWRYASESLIPGVWNQRQGITTGVMFKAEMTPLRNPGSDKSKAIAEAMNGRKMLYALNGVIYGDQAMVEDYVGKHPVSEVADVYYATLQVAKIGGLDQLNGTAVPVSVNSENIGFSIYSPDDQGHYYMYYPYFNRHNSEGIADGMTAMEFQVVRNNVYKLQVNSVYNFGWPDIPGNPDPDPDGKPDEDPKVLFRVGVQVVPWVVRVNRIDF